MFDYGQLYKIPTVIMRGGTSKGLILRRSDLPSDPELRDEVILRIYGSPDSTQIDGLGGGTSVTSKMAIVGHPTHPDAHIDYTFGQVSLDKKMIDYNVTCGNFVSAVGLYAVEEGYVSLEEPITTVRIFNTNTKKIIIAEIPVENGQILHKGKFSIDGVPGQASKIMLHFLNSGGTFTGKTLPTNNPTDWIKLEDNREFEVSIVDCVNTIVVVRAEDMGLTGIELSNVIDSDPDLLNTLEKIRVTAGRMVGLIKEGEVVSPTSHALPKIVMVTHPQDYSTSSNKMVKADEVDIVSRYISMGFLHRAHAVSGAMALAAAAKISGTIPNQITGSSFSEGLRVGHPTGTLYVSASVEQKNNEWLVTRSGNGRTARRLMEGYAYVPASLFKVKSSTLSVR